MNRVASGMNLVASGVMRDAQFSKKDSIGHIIVLNRVSPGLNVTAPLGGGAVSRAAGRRQVPATPMQNLDPPLVPTRPNRPIQNIMLCVTVNHVYPKI